MYQNGDKWIHFSLQKLLKSEQPHPSSVGRPDPGTAHSEQGGQDWFPTIELAQINNLGISAWVQEECCCFLPVSLKRSHQGRQEMGACGEDGFQVQEGGS